MVLLVDDDPLLRSILRDILEDSLGVPVREAQSGEEALPLACPGALVITDVNMPGMGGLGLIRRLRSTEGLRDVPVIAISGDGCGRDATLGAGATAFFEKPFRLGEFVDAARALLPAPASGPSLSREWDRAPARDAARRRTKGVVSAAPTVNPGQH